MTTFSFKPFGGGEAVTAYATRFRRSGVPPLEIAPPLDLFPEQPAPIGFVPQLTWRDPWTHYDRAGVYFVYTDSFELIYVGKAQCLEDRLRQYFGNGRACVLREAWGKPPRFIILVAVPKDMPFEVPSLEAYLISELQPILNTNGK